jgi:hypothetical protein
MNLDKDYSNYKLKEPMNLNQYKDIKDMERVMLKSYSGVFFKTSDEVRIEERIKKIRKLRKLIHFRQKVKDLF